VIEDEVDHLSAKRRVKAKNALAVDDIDAVARAACSFSLSNAIASAGGWPS